MKHRQPGPGHGPASVEVREGASGHQDHQPLHCVGEEEEGDGDPDEGVQDAERLPEIRERHGMAIT